MPGPNGRRALAEEGKAAVDKATAPGPGVPTYAQVVGAVNRAAISEDYVLTSAGGLPGELNVNWLAKATSSFDCEYGFSCMGYEISGGWGAAMAHRTGETWVLVGDGSYLMLNSDLYSSILSGHKMIVVVCDNGGFAVIERLQLAQGGASFNNMIRRSGVRRPRRRGLRRPRRLARLCGRDGVDLERARTSPGPGAAGRTHDGHRHSHRPYAWSEGGAFWEVGVPEVSSRPEVLAARQRMEAGKLDSGSGCDPRCLLRALPVMPRACAVVVRRRRYFQAPGAVVAGLLTERPQRGTPSEKDQPLGRRSHYCREIGPEGCTNSSPPHSTSRVTTKVTMGELDGQRAEPP